MTLANKVKENASIDRLSEVGAHYGYSKSHRHPATKRFVFATKNSLDVFDLEKTEQSLEAAAAFVAGLAGERKQVLFVGTKNESQQSVRKAAEKENLPFVVTRWVGGTLSNFDQIRKRIDMLLKLRADRESGALAKFTKKERVLIDRDIARLERSFGGLVTMTSLPAALFVVDPKHEHVACAEAATRGIPVIALANSDCDIRDVAYPIVANDSSIKSIAFFTEAIAEAYRTGVRAQVPAQKPASN